MIPIDGGKLVEDARKWGLKDIDTIVRGLEEMIKAGEFNLRPGTLIIQREEGYEKRECMACIHSIYNTDENVLDCNIRMPIFKHCKYHITESELKAAYIVGDGEK